MGPQSAGDRSSQGESKSAEVHSEEGRAENREAEGRQKALGASEIRRPLLEERLHAFAEILGAARAALRLALGLQLFGPSVIERRPRQAPDRAQRLCRPARQVR